MSRPVAMTVQPTPRPAEPANAPGSDDPAPGVHVAVVVPAEAVLRSSLAAAGVTTDADAAVPLA